MQKALNIYITRYTHTVDEENERKKGENKTARAKRKIASKSINLNKIYFKCQRQRKTIFVVFYLA